MHATSSHYVSLGDFRRRVTRGRRKSPLETLFLASFWHQRKILKNEGTDRGKRGKRHRVGRNSFNWKSEETRRRGRDVGWTGGRWRVGKGEGGWMEGPIAAVLYPRSFYALCVRAPRPLSFMLHIFSRVRRYIHVRIGPARDFTGTSDLEYISF